MPARPRVFAATALAVAVLTAGCINLGSPAAEYRGFDPQDAPYSDEDISKPPKPTPSTPVAESPPSVPTSPPPKPDPGVIVKTSWRIGDSWTYRAVTGPLLGSETTISIVGFEKRASSGVFIQKTELKLRNQPDPYVTYAAVDSATYSILNISGDSVRYTHTPGDPGPRFLRNGTYNYTVVRVQAPPNDWDPPQTRTYVKNASVRLLGPIRIETEAGAFDAVQFRTRTSIEGSNAEPATTYRWYSTKVLNDVFTMKGENGEQLELVRYRLAPR